ncbi:FAD/NAD(P)-binding protein [Nocardia sp. NPDC052566]|uniref:FAD/NAD(P)-binding protein n=1 Tax=Nocardia sp. NPDC052566 TaxID=3364330 RepID=UPI0037CC6198
MHTDGISIALIGCGPRGLNVLERLVACTPPQSHVTVHVIERGELGVGTHRPDQPDYLVLHTACGYVSAFAAPSTRGDSSRGPTLFEWARDHHVRVADGRNGDRPPLPTDHLPRSVLGRYLSWAARRIVASARCRIIHHRAVAETIDPLPMGPGESVRLDTGVRISVSTVILTVGHHGVAAVSSADPAADPQRWIGAPYPLPNTVAGIPAEATVAVVGSGLSAVDVIAALTVGRGGRYRTRGRRLDYLASGREPRIVLCSRSGLPARALPRLPDHPTERQPPRFLTPDAVAKLRTPRPRGELDFDADVLPLVLAELEHRYAHAGGTELTGSLAEILFDAVPEYALADAAAFQKWYVTAIDEDLVEAEAGVDHSPLKYALELFRDHLSVLRLIVDAPGLNEKSQEYFFRTFTAIINRLVIGPPAQRNLELSALISCGILRLGPGPSPEISWDGDGWMVRSTRLAVPCGERADFAIAAYLNPPTASVSENGIVRDLIAKGRLTARTAGTLEIGSTLTRAGNPVARDGTTSRTLFVLGPLAEGSSYYNHYVTSPNSTSRAFADATTVVEAVLDTTTART